MLFTLKVGKAEQYQDIDANETRLRVPFEIVDAEGVVVNALNESFPITATLPEVEDALKRHLEVFTQDSERFEANKEEGRKTVASKNEVSQPSRSPPDMHARICRMG